MSLIKEFSNTSSLLKHVLVISPQRAIQASIRAHAPTCYRCPHLTIWKYHLSPRSNWPICWVCPLNVPCSPDTCEFRLVAFRTFYPRWHCLERCSEGQMWLRYPLIGREHCSTGNVHGPCKKGANANATTRHTPNSFTQDMLSHNLPPQQAAITPVTTVTTSHPNYKLQPQHTIKTGNHRK